MALANLDLNFAYLIAQSSFVSPPDIALLGIVLIIAIIIYVFLSSCLHTILINLGQPNAWFAWVPLLQTWAMLEVGDRSPWWIIGLFIPFVNFVAIFFLLSAFINMVKKLDKNPWFILLMLIPLANFAVMYYFALM